MKKLFITSILSLLLLIFPSFIFATDVDNNKSVSLSNTTLKYDYLSSEDWCTDQTTICSAKRSHANFLSGVRLVFEPQFGTIFQDGENRIEVNNYKSLLKFGFETNLYNGWLSAQIALIYPSSVTFDNESPLIKKNQIKDGGKSANIDKGLSGGLSLIDGMLGFGFGFVEIDERDLLSNYEGNNKIYFYYFAVQPVAVIKTVFKAIKK